MKLSSRPTVVVLVRQDEVTVGSSKLKNDAQGYISRFITILRGILRKDPRYAFRDSFFVLGRSSMALTLECERLSDVPGLIQLIAKEHRNFRKIENDHGLHMGAFEAYYFPAIGAMPLSRKTENVIPTLFFIRTLQNPEDCVQWIIRNAGVARNVEAIYLGLGIYDLVIQAGFSTLHELKDFYCLLRKGLWPFWETSTLIGVPRRGDVSTEKKMAKHQSKIPFSTSVKCARGLDASVIPEIDALFRKRFSHFIPERKRHQVSSITNLRQGYMDLEAHYWCKTITEAFRVTCAIRKIDGVVDTCTVVQLPLDDKRKNNAGDT